MDKLTTPLVSTPMLRPTKSAIAELTGIPRIDCKSALDCLRTGGRAWRMNLPVIKRSFKRRLQLEIHPPCSWIDAPKYAYFFDIIFSVPAALEVVADFRGATTLVAGILRVEGIEKVEESISRRGGGGAWGSKCWSRYVVCVHMALP